MFPGRYDNNFNEHDDKTYVRDYLPRRENI